MNSCIRLFQKDAQRLWPYVLLYMVLLAFKLVFDPVYGVGRPFDFPLFQMLGILSCAALCLVVALLIHQENPVGDQPYWLTRPFTWRQILISKALFVLAFLWAPMFLEHIVALCWLRFPLFDALPGLLMKEAFFTTVTTLTVAALAATSRNIARLFAAAVIGVLIFTNASVRPFISGFYYPDRVPDWGLLIWIPRSLCLATLSLGAFGVLLLQYQNRRVGLSRVVGAIVLVVSSIFLSLPAGSWAFSLQERLSRKKIDASTIQITLDAERSSIPDNLLLAPPNPGESILRLPVRIQGLPAGMDLQCAAAQYTVKAPDIKIDPWSLDRRTANEWNAHWQGFSFAPLFPHLTLPINKDFYDRVKDSPVQIRGFLDLILVEHYRVDARHRRYFPGVGALERTSPSSNEISILTPWPRAHLAFIPANEETHNWFFVYENECAPWPTDYSLDPVVSTRRKLTAPPDPRVFHAVTQDSIFVRPVAYIRRYFAFTHVLPRCYYAAGSDGGMIQIESSWK
jgi:hypothetical protein